VPVLTSFGLGQESVYATAVTPDHFYEFDSEGFGLQQDYFDSVGLRSDVLVAPITRMLASTRSVPAAAVPMNVPTKGFGQILNLMHSATVTPAQQSSTTAYKSTHPVGTTFASRSATLQVDKRQMDNTSRPFTYPGSVLESIGFSIDDGGGLTTSLSFSAADELTTVSTPTGPSLTAPSFPASVAQWDSTQIGTLTVGGSAVAGVTSLNLNWAQGRADVRGLGNATRVAAVPNARPTIDGDITAIFESMALYTLFRTAAASAIVVDVVGAVIASTFHDEIKFTIPAAQIRGASPVVAGPDLISVTVPFTAGWDGTNAPLTIDYTSTDTAL
jgi:hypothetical protein